MGGARIFFAPGRRVPYLCHWLQICRTWCPDAICTWSG